MSTATQAGQTAGAGAAAAPATGRKAQPPGKGLDSGGGLFTIPYVVAFVLFLAGPILYGVWLAFTDESLASTETSFVGLDNWTEALGDEQVWTTLWHTVWFTILSTVPLVLVPLALALLVNAALPGQWFWRLVFFSPYLLPVTVVTIAFTWLYQPELGLFNTMLGWVGVEPVGWLTDEGTAMFSIVLATVWWTLGFNFLLYLAALQNIPKLLYEAAEIDGAGTRQRLFSITLPLLNRTTGLIIALQLLASLKVFDQIYLFTQGGPNGSTRPIIEYIYDAGFTNFRLGYAAAISYIFFALILVFSLAQTRLFAKREEYR